MTALCAPLVLLALALAATSILLRRKIMTLEESLQSFVEFNAGNIAALKEAIDQIPALRTEQITAAVQKAIADYVAEHPEGGAGSVPDEVLTSAIQSLTAQSKDILWQANAIALFMAGEKPLEPQPES